MTPNPYEPVSLPAHDRSTWSRLYARAMLPTPIRDAEDPPLRWVVDAIFAFVLCISGSLVAGLASETLGFLDSMAYPTALPIGLFPVGVWMHYCGVGRGSVRSNALLVLGLMTFYAIQGGLNSLALLPISIAVLTVVLPAEWIVGKFVLAWLPGSDALRKGQNHANRDRVRIALAPSHTTGHAETHPAAEQEF